VRRPVLLVGELNPYGDEPGDALAPWPTHASGARLMRILGLSLDSYLALDRMNLCAGSWDGAAAKRHAELILDTIEPGRVVVMLGKKVAAAFTYKLGAFTARDLVVDEAVDRRRFPDHAGTVRARTLVHLPHPSGLNHAWNDKHAAPRAAELVRRVAGW
jgi:hypothetical protein